MDRRLAVITAVCLIEAGFRLASAHVPMSGLGLTMTARLTETAVIIFFAFRLCGLQAASLKKEVGIGFAVAAAFGAAVTASHLISRLFMDDGLLGVILGRQSFDQWPLFLLVGCILGPFAEELFFRGLIYEWMRKGMAPAYCIVLTSLLFASLHGHISVIQLAGGLLFASIYEWRRSIWAPFVVHVLANIGIWIVPFILTIT